MRVRETLLGIILVGIFVAYLLVSWSLVMAVGDMFGKTGVVVATGAVVVVNVSLITWAIWGDD